MTGPGRNVTAAGRGSASGEADDLEPVLPEVRVEGKGGAKSETLHDGEARRVRVGKRFVGVFPDDLPGRGLVVRGDALHGPDVREKPPPGYSRPEPRETECMAFGDEEVRQQRLGTRPFEILEGVLRGLVTGVASIEETVNGARIYEDSRHRSISPSAR